MFKTIAAIALLVLLGSAVPQARNRALPAPVKRTLLQRADIPAHQSRSDRHR